MAYKYTEKVKDALGLSGNTYQDKPIQLYIYETIEDMVDSGVERAVAESEKAVGTVAIGVLDIWTNTSGKVTHSPYFFDRCTKLSYISEKAEEQEDAIAVLEIVKKLAQEVKIDKSSVEQTVQNFKNTTQQAVESVNTAKTQGVDEINTAKEEVVKAVVDKGTEQTGNVTKEGEKQVKAVAEKGQQILDSITEVQVNNPSTTYELQPNVQVVWGEVTELNITLAPEKPNAINIYPFWFTSGATPTKVTLPVGIILDGFVTKANKKYCCQIEQNVLFWKEFEVVA